ncbi:uncharacterized protein LOC123263034 isoform X2 [Cotesia glomerata]|uniref:uncharacterized protein LOC123263034 isoform X2 n=1 Tax=Cotesia glomerata TaxID=32391 RepID=UPI001D00E5B4|nr:uncharacterized protein LOC123263034 isoform X2 [Cotesia glomerata]
MSSITIGPHDSSPPGFGPAPPPPPPPPTGQMPTMRINTEMPRRPQMYTNDPYEPPAAIQNAMMTKDKKPFTYTPGMGGKLDLSQIRSPRMARRVAKNANDEGIEGPPKSPLANEAYNSRPVPGTVPGTTLIPGMVPGTVPLPGMGSVPGTATVPVTPPGPTSLFIQPQVAVPVFPTNVPRTVPRNSVEKLDKSQPTSPETPGTPIQITLAKAPTPWLQQKSKSPEELPEWAKRTSNSSGQESPPRVQVPVSAPIQAQKPAEKVIPVKIEDRPSVFTIKNEPGHHQFKSPPQQRWGNQNTTAKVTVAPPKPQLTAPGTYIVPIAVEGAQELPSYEFQPTSANQSRNQGRNIQDLSGAPVQSRSFRVLQKLTDTDNDDIDNEQLRKLQLTEDDKVLMNKFKEQVDGDTYLHQEEDPRYRGAAIPSRAFRYLQNMTDSNEVPINNAPRAVNSALKRQNRNSRSFDEQPVVQNLPPSEQQAPEPKKYTGSAIPSRSFRILQAMTTPDALASREIPVGHQGLFVPYTTPVYWAYYPLAYVPNQEQVPCTNPNNLNNIGCYPGVFYKGIDKLDDFVTSNEIASQDLTLESEKSYLEREGCQSLAAKELGLMVLDGSKHGRTEELVGNLPLSGTMMSNGTQAQEVVLNQPETMFKEGSNQKEALEPSKNHLKLQETALADVSCYLKASNLVTNHLQSQNMTLNSAQSHELVPNQPGTVFRKSSNQKEALEPSKNHLELQETALADLPCYLKASNLVTNHLQSQNMTLNSAQSHELVPNQPGTIIRAGSSSYKASNESTSHPQSPELLTNDVPTYNLIISQPKIKFCINPTRNEASNPPNIQESASTKTSNHLKASDLIFNSAQYQKIDLPNQSRASFDQGSTKVPTSSQNQNLSTSNLTAIQLGTPPELLCSTVPASENQEQASIDGPSSYQANCPMNILHEEEDTSDSSNNVDDGVPETSTDSDSDSYLAYSTGLNPDSDSKDSVEEGPTVNVSLPLKTKSCSEEVHADFTLSRPKSWCPEPSKFQETEDHQDKETDDDDSGVNSQSDLSRLISEVDTDSECSPRKVSSYKRTQTHSRLFKLISKNDSPFFEDTKEEEMISLKKSGRITIKNLNSPAQSLNFPAKAPPGGTPRNFRRPLSLEVKEDDFYLKWKDSNGKKGNLGRKFVKPTVLCPRTKSFKNLTKLSD